MKSKRRFLRPAKKTGAILGSSRPRASTDRKPRSQKRIDKFAALLADAVLPSPDVLGRESSSRKHTPAPLVAAVQEKLQADRDATLSAEELELCAAQIAQYAQSLPSPRERQVAGTARQCGRKQAACARVPGSKWARSSGCGMRIEGEDQRRMVACEWATSRHEQSFPFLFTK